MPVGSVSEHMKVFPHRKTIITLDSHLPSVQQPWLAFGRTAAEMAQTQSADLENVVNLPGIGWQLRGLQYDWGDGTELADAQGGFFTVAGGTLTTAPDVHEYNLFTQASLVGVTYGAGVASSGSPGIQKRVADTADWGDARLSADESAWPSPAPSLDAAPMDRIAKTVANHEPEDALFFTLWIPGSTAVGLSTVANLHFCGPAGSNSKGTGTGQYCLKMRADGRGLLYEKKASDGSWVKRHTLKWAEGNSNKAGTLVTMAIMSDCRNDGEGGFNGTVILFQPLAMQDGNYFSALADKAKSYVMQGNPDQFGLIYRVPKDEDNNTTLAPVRIDVRRDVRAVVQVGQLTYPESGTLFDDVISIPFPPNGDDLTPFYLKWSGRIPFGTTLTAKVYDADTGAVLADEAAVSSDWWGGVASFTPNQGQRRYRVKVTFTSNTARTKTPTLTSWHILRTNVFETPTSTTVVIPEQAASPALPVTVIESLEIVGQESEPSQAGASFSVLDYTGALEATLEKGGIPVKIETTYDAGGTNKATLFQGYVQMASSEWLAGDRGDWGGSAMRRVTFQCAGEWARLTEGLSPQRFEWVEQASSQPYKVTDVIRDLLLTCYPSSMVDIPDLTTRLHSIDANDLVLGYLKPIAEIAFRLAQDYFGAYLVFDESAGPLGKWRMLQQKRPPYNILARFYVNHPGDGKLPHVSASYGSSVSGDQTILHTYIQRGTWRQWVERAEANIVFVIGGGKNVGGTAISGKMESKEKLSAVAVNVNSYNFLGLSPGDPGYPDGAHPDFIGRVVLHAQQDSTLTTQAAVDWYTRRVFDRSCHARKRQSFVAPMILVTDATDAGQTRPRTMRYYDPIEVEKADGSFETFLVMSCSPAYTKDGFQFARYEVVRQSNIENLAVMPARPTTQTGMIMEAVRKMVGSSQTNADWVKNTKQIRQMDGWAAAADALGAEMQDLNPSSPTFGEFNYLEGFDPAP